MSLPCGESNHGRAAGNLVTVTIRLNLLLFSIKLVPQLHSAVNERKETNCNFHRNIFASYPEQTQS